MGPLGPKFDGFCANSTPKMTLGTFGPSVIFVVLFAQKPSDLGPNGPNIRHNFTNHT